MRARHPDPPTLPAEMGFFVAIFPRFGYNAENHHPVRIWAIVLATRFGERSMKDLLGFGGRIVPFLLYVSVPWAIV
jgi:hypothetical protein